MRIRWLLLGVLFAAAFFGSTNRGDTASAPRPVVFKKGTVTITQDGRRAVLNVEVADTFDLRARGLMHRSELAENAGVLFLFEDNQRLSFWMKNTLLPLSIAFIDAAWRINDIQDMNPPQPGGDIPIHLSKYEARYALEVNQGFFQRHNLTPGARVFYVPSR